MPNSWKASRWHGGISWPAQQISGDSTGSQQLNIGAQPVSWKKARLATWCND
jgi:hypothetical protein